MDYLIPEEEATNDMDFCPFPKGTHEDVERDNVSQHSTHIVGLLTGLQDTQKEIRKQDQKEAQKEAQRKAQRKFRRTEKDRRQEEQKKIAEQRREIDRLEAQSRELEKERQTRKGLEQQVQQLKAEIVQLKLNAKKWEENSTVLQGSVKALQRSLSLLCGESGVLCRNVNQPSAGSMTLSPSTSQSGPDTHVPPRNFPHLSNFHSKQLLWHADCAM